MSLFDNLFGRKKPEPDPVPPKPSTPAVLPPKKNPPGDPSKDPNMIKVFDVYGREMFITKEVWRTQVLPGTLKSNWDNAEQLAGVVIGSMNDGFFADVLAAAEQLCRIDPIPARGACAFGIVLLKLNRLDESEKVFRSYIQQHGEEGSILTNLAKVYSARNDHQKAEEILWHGLEVDPNQDNGFGWYAAIHRERGGEAAALDAMRRVAGLPGSWRAQLWLARQALQARQLEKALSMYQECLARAAKPVPADLLTQMSGDLGNAGHLPQILQLVEPHFDAKTHGLLVGNNLIKAHLDLGQIDAARRLLDQLYALNRMDWKQNLSYWDTELAKARVATATVDQKAPLKMAMLTIAGPVWLKPTSPAAELFSAKTSDAFTVAFLGCSTDVATNSKRVERQMADAPGRISRALPLFLAEQVEFGSQARVQTLVPWITNEGGGFVLSGVPWKDDDAANYARQGEIKSDYAVTIHLKPNAEPWTAELRLIRTIDAKCLGTLSGSFPSAKPEDGIPVLVQQLLTLLREQAEVEPVSNPALYQVPGAPHFAYYLLRLEQLLAVRCGSMEGVPAGFLSGEREIIDGNIQQCLNLPQNVPARLLLAQTLLAMKRARPDILSEFKDKLALLQKEKPLHEPAQGVVQRMVSEALAA